MWIVLGRLGQSITAVHLLGNQDHLALLSPYSTTFEAFSLVYGVPVFGFALLWIGLAVAVTAKAARDKLPFALTWWSFAFPVGTIVTGTSALALLTGLDALAWLSVAFYVGLACAWVTVAVRTRHRCGENLLAWSTGMPRSPGTAAGGRGGRAGL